MRWIDPKLCPVTRLSEARCTPPREKQMCGRVIQSSAPLRLAIVDGLNVSDSRVVNTRPRYNAAPSQELFVIRQNHKTGERSLDPVRWGLIPHWCSDPKGGRKPINAKAESISRLPMFREAYALRRCIVPIDGFFEWKAIRGARAKQPFAITMSDGSVEESKHRPMGTDVRDHHCAVKRFGGASPRPNASHP